MKTENAEKKANLKEKRSKKGIWIFLGIFLVFLLIAGWFVWSYFQKPVSGEIKISNPSSFSADQKMEFERFEGRYFSFAHDSEYKIKNHSDQIASNGAVLESAFLSQGEVSPKKIAMTIESLVGRSMQDSGNYIMRDKSKKLYKKENVTIQMQDGVSFVKTENGFVEKVFFIPKRDYLIEIAFTGPVDEEGFFEAEISDIIKSIQFKK